MVISQKEKVHIDSQSYGAYKINMPPQLADLKKAPKSWFVDDLP
jgi:hypothetical protein